MAVLPIGNNAKLAGNNAHSAICLHLGGPNIRDQRYTKHWSPCRLNEQRRNGAANGLASLSLRHSCTRHQARCRGAFRPHAAASSGALTSGDTQFQPARGLAQYDKLIIGLAVPALGSILLDPIMSLVDTGAPCQSAQVEAIDHRHLQYP